MTRLLATFFGVGLLKPAPGTWGSLAALPAFWIVHVLGGFPLVVVATLIVFAVGVWVTRAETAGKEDHDPSEIVIDEVAGQWIALWPVSLGAQMAGADVLALYPGWIAAFVFFRLFDIWKPGPVGWADRRHDAIGVMLDDVIAGVLAAVCVGALAAIAHMGFA
ncbi:MAG: phosphatidylglycerophosphatase A [Dinoroseobacter sp.]|nr:phosphatidylglycerophosphatase A [Dinoroseobacter sp.]